MKYVVRFARFWYDFIVGDDWRIAVSVLAGLAVTFVVAHQHVVVWWLLPVAVVVSLTASLLREARASKRR